MDIAVSLHHICKGVIGKSGSISPGRLKNHHSPCFMPRFSG
jgi:hypothetical protein